MPDKKRILFVDDEPNLLAGLRRMLRSMRREWEMVFVPGGSEALAMITQKPVDVVVSDMRMPGMNGVQLLREVMKVSPKTVRIVLSGQADRDAILEAVGPIHQYLSKPCDADTLKSTLQRACMLDRLLPNDELKQVVSQMETLPSLPALYSEVVHELQSPTASTTTLAQLISKDMGMSAKVLQLVNSAFLGLRSHVPSPAQAVIVLGLDTLKLLGLSAQVFAQFEYDILAELSIDTLWNHSLTVAEFARCIAEIENTSTQVADYAFVAGLLHDVGKLIFVGHYPQQYQAVMAQSSRHAYPLLKAERDLFGATHAEVGAYLLGLWGLPEPIVEAIYRHHTPDVSTAPEPDISPVTILHVADALEYEVRAVNNVDVASIINTTYLRYLGLEDRLPAWRNACAQSMQGELR